MTGPRRVESIGGRLRAAADAADAEEVLAAGAEALQADLELEAIASVERTLAKHRDDARLWLLLGMLHRSLEDIAPALEALRRSDALAPDNARTASILAFATLEGGMPAVDLFDRACALAAPRPDAATVLGRIAALVAEGRGSDAVADLQENLRISPRWPEGHARLARLRWAMGERDRFAESYEQAIRQVPDARRLWRDYAQALVDSDRFEAALAVLDRARATVGELPAFAATEAMIRSRRGEFAMADALFAELELYDDGGIAEQHCRHLLRCGRPEPAAELALRWTPRSLDDRFWPYLSLAWRLLGDSRWQWLEGDPAFIGVYDIAERLPPLDRLADRLRALQGARAQPLDQSLRGGTQTDGHLFPVTDADIQQLRAAVRQTVAEHIATLPTGDDLHPLLRHGRTQPVRFAGSWSVRLISGGQHANHVHPAGWLSSALYIALPGEIGGASDAGWLVFGEAQELGLALPAIQMVEPRPGRLALFPSTMWHGTRPFAAGERVTVAFDVRRPRANGVP